MSQTENTEIIATDNMKIVLSLRMKTHAKAFTGLKGSKLTVKENPFLYPCLQV